MRIKIEKITDPYTRRPMTTKVIGKKLFCAGCDKEFSSGDQCLIPKAGYVNFGVVFCTNCVTQNVKGSWDFKAARRLLSGLTKQIRTNIPAYEMDQLIPGVIELEVAPEKESYIPEAEA